MLQIVTYDDLDKFAHDLERTGVAYIGNMSFKMTHWGAGEKDVPCYERVIAGLRESIVGQRGDPFESLTQARRFAIADARQRLGLT